MAAKRYLSLIFTRISAAAAAAYHNPAASLKVHSFPLFCSNFMANRELCGRVALGMFLGATACISFEDIRASLGDLHPLLIPMSLTGYQDSIDGDALQGRNEGMTLHRYSIADAAAKAAPAVVNITATIGIHSMFLGKSSGSGFIIHPDGTILTNAHVVADAGKGLHTGKLVVTMQDGRTFSGEVINYDLLTDIAVVKTQSKTPLPTVKLGSSRVLRPGEWVIAMGSPLHLHNSVTVGIISCVDRKSSEIGLHGAHSDYIQTDAAINQGNSGGPLLNLDGEVIGITTMKAITADGVSFAIPIDTAINIVEQLKKHGRVVRPWLGMKMLELTAPIIDQLKERDQTFPNVTRGVLVPQVIPGSPAERVGIRAGDVIVQFDGKPISTVNQIVEALGDKTGKQFEVVVMRPHNQRHSVTVVAEEATPSF